MAGNRDAIQSDEVVHEMIYSIYLLMHMKSFQAGIATLIVRSTQPPCPPFIIWIIEPR